MSEQQTGVTVATAYTEACSALGEAIVMQRLQATEMSRLATENARLAAERDDLLHRLNQSPGSDL